MKERNQIEIDRYLSMCAVPWAGLHCTVRYFEYQMRMHIEAKEKVRCNNLL